MDIRELCEINHCWATVWNRLGHLFEKLQQWKAFVTTPWTEPGFSAEFGEELLTKLANNYSHVSHVCIYVYIYCIYIVCVCYGLLSSPHYLAGGSWKLSPDPDILDSIQFGSFPPTRRHLWSWEEYLSFPILSKQGSWWIKHFVANLCGKKTRNSFSFLPVQHVLHRLHSCTFTSCFWTVCYAQHCAGINTCNDNTAANLTTWTLTHPWVIVLSDTKPSAV